MFKSASLMLLTSQKGSSMKWSVEKKTLAGLGFASVILIGINALAYWNLSQHKKTAEQSAYTREVLEKLESLSSDLKDAETGQRGYILTGKDRYLKPYFAAVSKVNPEIQTLRKLTADSPQQQKRLASLRPLVDQKFAELDQTISLRKDEGLEAAQQVVLTDQGKYLMDQIRRVIQEMEKEERDKLEQSLQQAQANAQKTPSSQQQESS
jgi:CHASE3 domain sensor protein